MNNIFINIAMVVVVVCLISILVYASVVTTWDCYFDTPANPDDILRDAKECAIICCDQILEVIDDMSMGHSTTQELFFKQVKELITKF